MDRQQLVDEHTRLAFYIACRLYRVSPLVRRVGEEEDAKQTAMVGLIRAARQFPGIGSFKAYMSAAVRNELFVAGTSSGPVKLTRESRQTDPEKYAAALQCGHLGENAALLLDRPEEEDEKGEAVQDAVRSLSPPQQETVEALYWHGESVYAHARRIGRREMTVNRRHRRALANLKRRLSGESTCP